MKDISRLHIITQALENKSHLDQIRSIAKTNADWVQLRVKDVDQSTWFEIGREAKSILSETNIKLIINDNVYLAKEIEADGVHLGQDDMSIEEARDILGNDIIIGGTANTYDQILAHYENGVDYVGLGPYRTTKTKKKLAPVIEMFAYEVIFKKCEINKIDIPVIPIGGIEINDVSKLMAAGAYGVAVSSAIVKQNIIEQVEAFSQKISNFQFSSDV